MDEFPKYNSLTLNELTNEHREIALKHLKLSGKLELLGKLRSFLIKEVHDKKSVKKRIKYKIQDPLVEHYYNHYLFHGTEEICSFTESVYTKFASYLEELFRVETRRFEQRNKFNYTELYYNHYKKPDELKFDDFDEEEWVLDAQIELSERDVQIFNNFKELYITTIDSLFTILMDNSKRLTEVVPKQLLNSLKTAMNKQKRHFSKEIK